MYVHGTYKHEDYKKPTRDALLQFATLDADDKSGAPVSVFFFDLRVARKLSRALTFAAAILDGFDQR